MHTIRILAIGIAGLLAFSAGAQAATINVTSGSSYTATARQTLTLDPGGLSIACDLSFAISLTATTMSGTLPISAIAGVVSRGSGGNCTGGATMVLLNLPWALLIANGTGRADGTVMSFNNVQLQVAIGGLFCLYRGNLSYTVGGSGSVLSANTALPFYTGGFLCPRPGRVQGTMALSPALAITLTP